MDAGISGSQEAAEQRGCRCYQVNVSRVVGGSTDVENFKLGRRRTGRSEKRKEERVEEARDVERGEREERGKKEKKREREREGTVGEKTMEHGGAWLSGSHGGDKYGV